MAPGDNNLGYRTPAASGGTWVRQSAAYRGALLFKQDDWIACLLQTTDAFAGYRTMVVKSGQLLPEDHGDLADVFPIPLAHPREYLRAVSMKWYCCSLRMSLTLGWRTVLDRAQQYCHVRIAITRRLQTHLYILIWFYWT